MVLLDNEKPVISENDPSPTSNNCRSGRNKDDINKKLVSLEENKYRTLKNE